MMDITGEITLYGPDWMAHRKRCHEQKICAWAMLFEESFPCTYPEHPCSYACQHFSFAGNPAMSPNVVLTSSDTLKISRGAFSNYCHYTDDSIRLKAELGEFYPDGSPTQIEFGAVEDV